MLKPPRIFPLFGPFWASKDRINASRTTDRWSTSSRGDGPDTLPAELSRLSDHIASCRQTPGQEFMEAGYVESVKRFVANHVITVLLPLMLLLLIASTAF